MQRLVAQHLAMCLCVRPLTASMSTSQQNLVSCEESQIAFHLAELLLFLSNTNTSGTAVIIDLCAANIHLYQQHFLKCSS